MRSTDSTSWHPASWQSRKATQQPAYDDPTALSRVVAELARLPPIVVSWEVDNLTARLAKLGHECTGVDFSPASIEYAREYAQKMHLHCSYQLQDIREADFGSGYSLGMFIFGEFNVFKPEEAQKILNKVHAALQPGGSLLLEVHTFEVVHQMGLQPAGWYSSKAGLFSDRPHLCLQENFWEADQSVATQRFFIVDAQTSQVTRFAASTKAYTNQQYLDMLIICGFQNIAFYPSLLGEIDPSQHDFFAILARKKTG